MEELLAEQVTFEQVLNFCLMILIIYGILEMAYLILWRKYEKSNEYKQTTTNFVFVLVLNIAVATFIGVVSTATLSILGFKLSLFQLGTAWYLWPVGLLIYEFFYWVQHWLAHKVRILWCLHSPHHAPESMNMFVGFNHSFLETMFYMPFFLGFMPALFGVHPFVILGIVIIDVTWGNLLHINDSIVTGRYGILEKILQTPSYHRVHHAQNVRYMDTNYNSITLFWDWALRTLQPLEDNEPVRYGITREVKTTSFWDVQFGEFVALFKDMVRAPGIIAKLKYAFMPPGWSHTGEHQTASMLKSQLQLQS